LPTWATVQTDQAQFWHGSIHHARQFRGWGMATLPVLQKLGVAADAVYGLIFVD